MTSQFKITLTPELIFSKIRTNNLESITQLNLVGMGLGDVSVIGELKNLQIISLSVNRISGLEVFSKLIRLRDLYLRRNEIEEVNEISRLRDNSNLRLLWLSENPVSIDRNYKTEVMKWLPQLKSLDGQPLHSDSSLLFIHNLQFPLKSPEILKKRGTTNMQLDSIDNFILQPIKQSQPLTKPKEYFDSNRVSGKTKKKSLPISIALHREILLNKIYECVTKLEETQLEEVLEFLQSKPNYN